MRRMILLVCLCLCLCLWLAGCAGAGLEKRATFVPDSVTVGWGQETYHGDPEAWRGFNVSATWEFK